MNATATLPLIEIMQKLSITHRGYAENGIAMGILQSLLKFFRDLSDHDNYFGYLKTASMRTDDKRAHKLKNLVTEAENICSFELLEKKRDTYLFWY